MHPPRGAGGLADGNAGGGAIPPDPGGVSNKRGSQQEGQAAGEAGSGRGRQQERQTAGEAHKRALPAPAKAEMSRPATDANPSLPIGQKGHPARKNRHVPPRPTEGRDFRPPHQKKPESIRRCFRKTDGAEAVSHHHDRSEVCASKTPTSKEKSKKNIKK